MAVITEFRTKKAALEAAARCTRYIARRGGNEIIMIVRTEPRGKWSVEIGLGIYRQYPNIFDVLTEGAM